MIALSLSMCCGILLLNTPSQVSAPTINSYCLVLSKDGVRAVPLDSTFNYKNTIDNLRTNIFPEPGKRPGTESAFETERNALYQQLLKPVLEHIPGGVKNVMIVPDGPLMSLPFDILRESATSPDFGQTYRLSLSPSVSVSMLNEGKAPRLEPRMAMGGAWYDPQHQLTLKPYREITRSRLPPLSVVEKAEWTQKAGVGKGAEEYYEARPLDGTLSDLPGSLQEVQDLQRTHGFSIFTGLQATEMRIKELSRNGRLVQYALLHFACHGLFDEDVPAMSSMVFAEASGLLRSDEDGYLTVPEIALLNLNAQMVLLSACQTGLGQVKRGDGMVGLPRSFLVAGARNVGVSLWSIDDAATKEFMGRVYRKVLREGQSFRDAYYAVKSEFRNEGNYQPPYFWAAFVLYE
jgi:CHAT domain-containing protein